jgi:hypothetical protein
MGPQQEQVGLHCSICVWSINNKAINIPTYVYNIEKKEEKALAQPTNQSIGNQWTDLLAAENRHINNIAHSEETSIEKHFF